MMARSKMSKEEMLKYLKYLCTSEEEELIRLHLNGLEPDEIAKKLKKGELAVFSKIDRVLELMKKVTPEELKRMEGQRPVMRESSLSTPTRMALWRRNLRTLEQIAEAGYNGLCALGVRKNAISHLRHILESYGLQLKDKDDVKKDFPLVKIEGGEMICKLPLEVVRFACSEEDEETLRIIDKLGRIPGHLMPRFTRIMYRLGKIDIDEVASVIGQ
ncbi:MAG: hypothetical protein QXI19_05615, partial [Candidatus Caldarchaeum sp.]